MGGGGWIIRQRFTQKANLRRFCPPESLGPLLTCGGAQCSSPLRQWMLEPIRELTFVALHAPTSLEVSRAAGLLGSGLLFSILWCIVGEGGLIVVGC